jgi:8-oxo-dGTP pyrophosphatase MutT (NUDIX family)
VNGIFQIIDILASAFAATDVETAAKIAQIAGALVAVTTLVFILWQLRLRNKQMRFQALTELHKELIGPAVQESLRFIYSHTPGELTRPRSEDELSRIELVLNTYDLIGFRIRKHVLPKKETLETEAMLLLRIWSQLKDFVERQRRLRNDPSYKEHLQWLANKARKKALRKKDSANSTPPVFDYRKQLLARLLNATDTAITFGDFKIDFGVHIGNIDASKYNGDEINVTYLDVSFQPADPVAGLIRDQWKLITQIAQKQGRQVINGPLARLIRSSKTSGNKISIILQPTDYKTFATTNLLLDQPIIHRRSVVSPISIRELAGGDLSRASCYLANPLNVIAMLITSDGFTFIPKRSLDVYERPGTWQASVGGALNPQENPTATLIREVKEEWGLDIDKSEIQFLVLGVNQRTSEPDLVAMVELKEKDFEHVVKAFSSRQDKSEFTSFESREVAEGNIKPIIMTLLCNEWSQPSDQAALLITLVRKFGRKAVERAFRELQL